MNEITLMRGGREVVFRKSEDTFAVRLKQGRAMTRELLEATYGASLPNLDHVESFGPERMEVFRVTKAKQIEPMMETLRQAPATEVVTHVYTMDDAPGATVIPTGMMMIQFAPETSKADREAILDEFGLEVLEEIPYLADGYVVRLTAVSPINPLKMAAELQQRAQIKAADPDIAVPVAYAYAPPDTYYEQQWHLKNRGDKLGLLAGADVKAEEAWDYTTGTRQIVVCVIDDGVDLQHPDFAGADKIVAPRDFGQMDGDPNPFYTDDNHGTACAGVAVAEQNGAGVVGLAPGCALMPVRMSRWLTDDLLVGYFEHAMTNGADVISCSWSAAAWNYPLSDRVSGIIHHAATQGRNGKGCVILFAAGNEERPLNGNANGQISYQGFALHPDVIAVGASNSLDKHAHYSNYGAELALCAPSSGTPGRRIVTTDRRGALGYDWSDYTDSFGGTSSATPLAAGLAALILSVNPELTAVEVKQMMMETADKIDAENGTYVDGHSERYGYGRINAHKAVAKAMIPGAELDILTVELMATAPTSAGQTLAADIQFKLTGSRQRKMTQERAAYTIEVRLGDLDDGGMVLLASQQGQLQPELCTYLERLTFAMPDAGRYELQTAVSLAPPYEAKTTYNGPRFSIIA